MITSSSSPSALPEPGDGEQPEHRNDRRRFLIFALMAGLVKTETVTARIVAEVELEGDGA